MTRARAWLALALLAGLAVVGGCAGEADRRPPVVLWHSYSGAERVALEDLAAQWNQQHDDVRLVLVAVPYEAFADKLSNAIPNGNGPDLFIFAHDRIGDWQGAGLVEPLEYYVDPALADRYEFDAVAAMAYRGSLYGLPLAVKTSVLYYRTDQVKSPPRTTDELLALGRTLTHGDHFGLIYKNNDLYGHAAWLFGMGGHVFTDDGRLDVANPAAVRAVELAQTLGGAGGIVPPGVTGTMVGSLFAEGKVAMAISGPWLIADLPKDVPWAVAPLPIVSATGQPARPFLGAEGVLMSSRAHDKDAAFRVAAFLASDASAIARARAARQVVPNHAAYAEPDLGGDPVLATFARAAADAVPMPATPEMRMVWTPYENALTAALSQGKDAHDVLAEAEHEIAGYIAGAAAP